MSSTKTHGYTYQFKQKLGEWVQNNMLTELRMPASPALERDAVVNDWPPIRRGKPRARAPLADLERPPRRQRDSKLSAHRLNVANTQLYAHASIFNPWGGTVLSLRWSAVRLRLQRESGDYSSTWVCFHGELQEVVNLTSTASGTLRKLESAPRRPKFYTHMQRHSPSLTLT